MSGWKSIGRVYPKNHDDGAETGKYGAGCTLSLSMLFLPMWNCSNTMIKVTKYVLICKIAKQFENLLERRMLFANKIRG